MAGVYHLQASQIEVWWGTEAFRGNTVHVCCWGDIVQMTRKSLSTRSRSETTSVSMPTKVTSGQNSRQNRQGKTFNFVSQPMFRVDYKPYRMRKAKATLHNVVVPLAIILLGGCEKCSWRSLCSISVLKVRVDKCGKWFNSGNWPAEGIW